MYHDDYLCVWVCVVYAVHEVDVAVIEGRTGDVVLRPAIVCTQVNDN